MSPRLNRHLIPGPYKFSIYRADCSERRHIHVLHENKEAKFWLEPEVELFFNRGYRAQEILDIERLVRANHQLLTDFWNDACK